MALVDSARISPVVLIRGAGEMASAIAWRLHMANFHRIIMTDLDAPLCVRRTVSFCTALQEGRARVEGVEASAVRTVDALEPTWREGRIAIVPLSRWDDFAALAVDIVIDAILAKRNIATHVSDAPLVVALGPGFVTGRDCHFVIETNRGHHLGRIVEQGGAEPNTGIPGDIAGHTRARVFRSPADGAFESERKIGDRIEKGDCIGYVAGAAINAEIGGILRGLLRPRTWVAKGVKLGDIDPRGRLDYCDTISDKARAIAGSVLECVMRRYNRTNCLIGPTGDLRRPARAATSL